MIEPNLYWSVYKNLEREFLGLADVIHFDDAQLDVYSVRLADLIVRCAVEIEGSAKILYFRPEIGGKKPCPKFDFDCLKELDDKWMLSHKVVLVTAPTLYFSQKEIMPLLKLDKFLSPDSKDSGDKKKQ